MKLRELKREIVSKRQKEKKKKRKKRKKIEAGQKDFSEASQTNSMGQNKQPLQADKQS